MTYAAASSFLVRASELAKARGLAMQVTVADSLTRLCLRSDRYLGEFVLWEQGTFDVMVADIATGEYVFDKSGYESEGAMNPALQAGLQYFGLSWAEATGT